MRKDGSPNTRLLLIVPLIILIIRTPITTHVAKVPLAMAVQRRVIKDKNNAGLKIEIPGDTLPPNC